MSISSRQIGWGTEENLLWQISKQLERLTQVTAISSGVISLSAIGSVPNANGGTITGTILNLQPASASFGGVITTGTQAFEGAKTFNKDLIVNTLTVGLGGGQISTNTALGVNALLFNTTGSNNTATGLASLFFNTTGQKNTANGVQALYSNTTGSNNVATGYLALGFNTTGNNNTANGFQALYSNSTGGNNTALGLYAGYAVSGNANTTGDNNIFIGYNSIGVSATASNRTWIGNNLTTSTWLAGNVLIGTTTDTGFKLNVNGSIFGTSLAVNTSGQEKTITTFYGVGSIGQNIFIGGGGLFSNTGGGSSVNGSYNTSLGGDSLIANTIGSRNVAIGFDALRLNTTGNQNTAIGARTLTQNTTGIQNTAVGLNALYYNTTGNLNTGIGRQSLHNNDTGYSNTAIGQDSLYLNTTGYQNFAGGRNALYNNTTGFNNIAIGNGTGTTNTTGSNNIFIGNGTTGVTATDSNRTFIGNSSTTSTWLAGNVLIGTTTDVASSKLTISSTTQGFLPPRMTTTEINAIASPAAGLVVYNTTLAVLCFYDGTGWKKVSHSPM